MVDEHWFIRTKSQSHSRLFCFPYAGGGASIYRLWPDKLASKTEVCLVQLPGRGNRIEEAPFTQLPLLIQELTRVLKPYLDIPFCFFGHSMGALIAFELARSLRQSHLPLPTHLFLAAHRAPQVTLHRRLLYTMPDREFIEAAHTFGGIPQAVLQDEELMTALLPALRADFTIYEMYTYTPELPLSCPMTIFGGKQDQIVRIGDLIPWREQTHGKFALKMLPGDHFFIHSCQELMIQAIIQDLP
jgi:medium-chain acyl-[acyl-carrier-protein] hydrolase